MAAFKGDLDQVRRLLINGVDTNTQFFHPSGTFRPHVGYPTRKGGHKTTPLHYAVLGKRKEAIELLLDKGAKINETDTDGWTPLHVAVVSKSKAIIELLLKRGASSPMRSTTGPTLRQITKNEAVLNFLGSHQPIDELYADRGDKSHASSTLMSQELRAARTAISKLITEDVYFKELRSRGFGKPGQTRTNLVFSVSLALVEIFGARLKEEATRAIQMAWADLVMAHSEQIAFEIQFMDTFDFVGFAGDIGLADRVAAFIRHHVPAQTPKYSSARFGRDISDGPDTTGLPLPEFKEFVTSSKALLELRLSLRHMLSPPVLEEIISELSKLVPERPIFTCPSGHHEIQANFDIEWDLSSFVKDEIKGEIGTTEKVRMLWSVITVTGNVEKAWLTTCKEYMRWKWPDTAQAVMTAVENSLVKISSDEFWAQRETTHTVLSERLPKSNREAGRSK